MPREVIEFDVVIVGAGPAGLAAACRLGQLAAESASPLEICVVDKSAAVGAHIISGAVFETHALDELFADWRQQLAPVTVPVGHDRLRWLFGRKRSITVPKIFAPRSLNNAGNYIISLGELCCWLAERAESLGCHLLMGQSAAEVTHDGRGAVSGVITGDFGLDRDGRSKAGAEPGYELKAKYVVFAEGCRGSLSQRLVEEYDLSHECDPQHYGLAFKEIWEVTEDNHHRGRVEHTLGWPLAGSADGGGFIYHGAEGRVSVGLIVALDYRNPHIDPFAEFQRWKQHPFVARTLRGGRRIAYGARAVNRGGLQSLPKLVVPGGVLIGCAAGFLVPAKIKGSHTAMKSGMLAAEAIHAALQADSRGGDELRNFEESIRRSWVWEELQSTRNFAPAMTRYGTILGGALAFLEQNLLRHSLPFTMRNRSDDRRRMLRADEADRTEYPEPDGQLSFDRLSSVYLANTQHREDQPVHLRLADQQAIAKNLAEYDEPAQRYCPAGVYEIVRSDSGQARLQINAANCIHCKACDIKDPADNIRWVTPEGGSGPNYVKM